MDKKINSTIGMLSILIVAIMVGLFTWAYQNNLSPNDDQGNQNLPRHKKNNQVACTQEAQQCPDGSYVSRTGPNCEFAKCPNEQIVGGSCSYDKITGNCSILSITKDGTVKFAFAATGTLPDNPLAKNLNGEHFDSMNIFNDQNLSVKVGDKMNCEASIETKGTCTPVIFKLASTDQAMNDMHIYQNKKLGIELEMPNDTKVVESGNVVWISVENSHGVFYPEYSKDLKQINSLSSNYKKVSGISWAILVEKAQNDTELESFIKERYGKDCKLGAINPSSQGGVFDVTVDAGNSAPGEGCFLNWALAIKYYPEKGLVAAWDLGQAPNFFDANGAVLDEQMSKSFKFIQ